MIRQSHHARLTWGFLAFGALSVITLIAQPVQIHPVPPAADRPIVIAVLADGFAANQEADFNEAAANFFNHGLLADDVYAAHRDLFTIKTIFQPVAAGTISNFGFVLQPGVTNCIISWDASPTATNTASRIELAASPANPTHIVVIGNHNYNFGCSADNWAYVAVGAVGQYVLQHEFGHQLANLYDEYLVPEFASIAFPGVIDELNCSTQTPPHWQNSGLPSSPPLVNASGCALYGVNVVHGYPNCVMGSHGTTFCHICKREMEKAFDYFKTTTTADARGLFALPVAAAGLSMQATTQPPGPVLRLLISVNPQTGAATVLTATETTGRTPAMERRIGQYVFEVTEKGQTIAMGILPGDPFASHGYRGGASQHARVPGKVAADGTASILVTIPGETRDSLTRTGRAVEIELFRLNTSVKDPIISRDRFRDLKNKKEAGRIARLSADQLRDGVTGKPQPKPRAQ